MRTFNPYKESKINTIHSELSCPCGQKDVGGSITIGIEECSVYTKCACGFEAKYTGKNLKNLRCVQAHLERDGRIITGTIEKLMKFVKENK